MSRSSKKSCSAKKYSHDHLLHAIEEVKNGSTQFSAAKKYGIPRSTLFNKISGKTELGKKSGPGTVLSTEEENIVKKWILSLAERGFPVRKQQLLRSIQLYLNRNQRETPFRNNYPGRKWYQAFLKRHPIISKRMAQNLTPNRAAVTENQIRCWHSEVYKYCEDNDLIEVLNDPTRIFNMDEKGFYITQKNDVVLTKRGDKAVYKGSQNDEKECVTALLGGSAAGKETPPMMVHTYKRMPAAILLNMPDKWSVGISDNGWQTQRTFFDYFTNVFYKWLLEEEITLPIILFIDGHKSHISLPLSDFCADHKIELIALYPNSTHLIQPMDVGVLKPVNTSWETKLEAWKLKYNFAKVDKKDIAPILHDSISAIDYASHLKKGFKKCGLFPFNADNINYSRILKSISTAVASQDELWNGTENVILNTVQIQISKENEKREALSRLQNFERFIDGDILKLFKLSITTWSGPMEYGPLFEIWTKMALEASEVIAVADSSTVIVNDLDNQDQKGTSSEETGHSSILGDNTPVWIVIDDSQLLSSEVAGSMIEQYEENAIHESNELDDELYTVVEIPHSEQVKELAEGSSENGVDSISFEHKDGRRMSIDMGIDEFRSVDVVGMPISALIKPIGGSSGNGGDSITVEHEDGSDMTIDLGIDEFRSVVGMPISALIKPIGGSSANVTGGDSITVEHEDGSDMSIDLGIDEMHLPANMIAPARRSAENVTKVDSKSMEFEVSEEPMDLSMPKKNCPTYNKTFDKEAFKKSFYWPKDNAKKKKDKPPHVKRSTVISSVVWRDEERKKLEDKLKIEAEKEARKVMRETKKMETAAIAAEKKMAKELKKKTQKTSQKVGSKYARKKL